MTTSIVAPTPTELRDAEVRLRGQVRRTPIIELELGGRTIVCKLEQLQRGGSFKIRGALNRMQTAAAGELERGVVTASGGNHGIGVALAAAQLGVVATVFMPTGAPAATARRIVGTGARVLRHGLIWDDAWAAAVEHAAREGGLLVHPFEDAAVVAGQSTVGAELLADAPALDGVVVAIGGGGLIAGVALALHAARPSLPIIGVEPTGAASMQVSVQAGRVVPLERVQTIAGTLAPRSVGPLTRAICAEHVGELVLVSDDEMRSAMRLLWDELRVLVEPAGAAAIAAIASGRMRTVLNRPAVVVCGANPEDAEVRRMFGGG